MVKDKQGGSDPSSGCGADFYQDAIATLDDAIEMLRAWGSYASDFYQVKYDLDGDIANLQHKRDLWEARRSREAAQANSGALPPDPSQTASPLPTKEQLEEQ